MATELKALNPFIGTGEGYVLSGNFSQDIYNISYNYTSNGIITYTFTVNQEELARQAKEAAPALVAAIISAIAAYYGVPAQQIPAFK